MCRFLFQQKGIVEKRITQELVVFPRDYVDAITVVCIHGKGLLCNRSQCRAQKELRPRLEPQSVLSSSVPYRTSRRVCPMMSLASCSSRFSSNGTHVFLFVFFCSSSYILSFGSDGGLELVHGLVILDDRPVYRRGGQFRVEVGVITHDHFRAVRGVRIIERDHPVAFFECE